MWLTPQLADRRGIQMIIMIMADQHVVDRRQVRERNSRLSQPAQARRRDRSAIPENRIRQNIAPVQLDQKSRVPDPGHLDLVGRRLGQVTRRDRLRLISWQLIRRHQRRFHRPAPELPAKNLTQPPLGNWIFIIILMFPTHDPIFPSI